MPFTEDLAVFYGTIYGGIVVGILFDFYRVAKSNFNLGKILSNIYDIIFWIVTTALTFSTINFIESFDLRYYHFVALGIGFLIYYKTVSKFVFTVLNNILQCIIKSIKNLSKIIVAILTNLYYVTVYSLHFLFDIIFYIPNLIINLNRFFKFRILRKINKKQKNSV